LIASSARARRRALSPGDGRVFATWGRARNSISNPENLIVKRLNLGVTNLVYCCIEFNPLVFGLCASV